jgi:ATP-dependent DNA helicase RecG
MGTAQKGRNDLRLASLRRDKDWVAKARTIAFELVDAGLDAHPTLVEELELLLPEAADVEDAETPATEFLFKG